MQIFKRVEIWIKVILSLLATFNGVENNILDAETTVEKINAGKSLIRFGDGEFGIYKGKNIHYQKWSDKLLCEFEKIKSDFEKEPDKCPYLLALPKKFMSCKGYELAKKRVYVSSWAQSRYQFKREFDTSLAYGDSFLFEKKNKDIYARLFTGDKTARNVIFIHNNESFANAFAKQYGKNVFFVACPSSNAFEQVEAIEECIEKTITDNSLSKDNVLLVISAGPAGKVIVYRYSNKGYHCIDAGHCWDDPLESE